MSVPDEILADLDGLAKALVIWIDSRLDQLEGGVAETGLFAAEAGFSISMIRKLQAAPSDLEKARFLNEAKAWVDAFAYQQASHSPAKVGWE